MDIDREAIKAVQLVRGEDGYTLQHVGYHRLPEGVIVDGEVADSELLSREIRKFWELHEFRGRSVVLGVAGNNVIVRFVDFPRLSPEDLESALGFQAEEHIPMPMEDVILDHVVLGPSTENPDDDHVILVAAHREMISSYTGAVREGGLKPVGIDVKALSLTRSALPEDLFDDEDTTLLLDVGTEFSNLVVVQGRTPTHSQFLNLGLRNFVASVTRSADLSQDEAERLALEPEANISPFTSESGLSEDPGDDEPGSTTYEITEPLYIPKFEEATEGGEATGGEQDDAEKEAGEPREGTAPEPEGGGSGGGLDPALVYDIRRGLEDAASRLAAEVQRSVEFHNSRPSAREVSRILVSGEGALVAGLGGYLEDYLGVPAGLAKPTGRLVANTSNVSDEQLAQMEPVLAVALGLAMEE
ncbi:type IV pilus assembly protein PilM [Rubrobacter indicoceani]|uniref:type IV pilus assembly protein PilM n=1 Tax=Rubrobacter indicoceani TaxID=2051957 RepID=UPI0013C4385A|nr:type IV pilus assembly protein PilM [Rubrobacter indicoceani]